MTCRPRLVAGILLGLASVGLDQPARAEAPLHHDIRLIADPDDGRITVADRITVSGRRSVTLRVAPWMRMSNVRVDGNAIGHSAAGTSLTVAIPSLGTHQIDVAAAGVVPKIDPKATRGRSASEPAAGAQGLYLPGWSRWFPGTADETVSYRLTVETPTAHRVAATGALQSEDLGELTNTSVFVSQRPIEPPSVFAGPYEVSERTSGKLRLRTYFHRSAAGLAETYLETSERFIRDFERQIGSYPFADFHIISAPLPVGLGFPNLTYVDRRILPLPFMRGRSLAHEVLHNWWGNGVRTDYETGNWSEGLTTYMADHALAKRRSARDAAVMRLGWLRDFAALPGERDIPVTRFVAKQHDASQVVGYGKVAFIFHMLKHEIGVQPFDAGIKRFWDDNKFAKAGWSDLQAAFEATAQRDLGWFFLQWTARAGAPRLTLEDARVSRSGEGYTLAVSLAQTPPAYKLKVPVEVTTGAGTVRSHIVIEDKSATQELQFEAKPLGLHVDPDYTLFRRLLPGEAPPILRDVLLDESAKTVMLHDDPASRKLARALADRLFNGARKALGPQARPDPDTPLLVFGSKQQIDRFIGRSGLPARPAEIEARGSARAWTARRAGGKAVLFVEADGPEALGAMMRPLPHYRSKSYIVFEGHRAVARGVWPAAEGPLAKKLE